MAIGDFLEINFGARGDVKTCERHNITYDAAKEVCAGCQMQTPGEGVCLKHSRRVRPGETCAGCAEENGITTIYGAGNEPIGSTTLKEQRDTVPAPGPDGAVIGTRIPAEHRGKADQVKVSDSVAPGGWRYADPMPPSVAAQFFSNNDHDENARLQEENEGLRRQVENLDRRRQSDDRDSAEILLQRMHQVEDLRDELIWYKKELRRLAPALVSAHERNAPETKR